jgi:hypothetical protein
MRAMVGLKYSSAVSPSKQKKHGRASRSSTCNADAPDDRELCMMTLDSSKPVA